MATARVWSLAVFLASCSAASEAPPDTAPAPDAAATDASALAIDAALGPDAGAMEPDAGPSADPVRAARVCAALDALIASSRIPGGVVGVRFENGALHLCAAGVSAGRPITTEDRFFIGSVTKTFVAAAVLLLVEDGALTLDDPLSRWVPGFRTDPTIAQLLNHTAGLGEYLFDGALRADSARPHTIDELLTVARAQAPQRQPGVRFEYSNTHYLALGAVITAAAGVPWPAYVRERVLGPMGLPSTFIDGFEPVPDGLVRGYEVVNGALADVTESFHSTVGGAAGAMMADGRDLLVWAHGLYGGPLLSPASRAEMSRNHRVPYQDGNGASATDFVGLGDFISVSDEFGDEHGHSGGRPGYGANVRYLERSGLAQITLLNLNASSSERKSIQEALWIALLQ